MREMHRLEKIIKEVTYYSMLTDKLIEEGW